MTLLAVAVFGLVSAESAAYGYTSRQKSLHGPATPNPTHDPSTVCGARHAAACSFDSTGRTDRMPLLMLARIGGRIAMPIEVHTEDAESWGGYNLANPFGGFQTYRKDRFEIITKEKAQ